MDTVDYNEQAQKLWSIYVAEAEQHDSNITETWKADMDSTLIFAGLFSAVVTAFIIESYKLLKPDSGEVTNAILTQILALQVGAIFSNTSAVPNPSVISGAESTNKPSDIAVNMLWFLSLAFSLAAALCVTLVQQWVRDYTQRIQRNNGKPLRRARMRAFLFEGSEKWKMDAIVEYIPILLHVSLFLFFAGLCIFLLPISIPVAGVVIGVVVCCLTFYGFATLSPFVDLSAPYETPLSGILWPIVQAVIDQYESLSSSLTEAREQFAMQLLSVEERIQRDTRAVQWVWQRLSDEHELQPFVESVPGFLESDDGQRTWSLAFGTSDVVKLRITDLLETCNPSGYLELQARNLRTNVCLNALSKLSVFSFDHARDHSNWLATKAICMEVLFGRRDLVELSRQIPRIPSDMRQLASTADLALNAVERERQKLEDLLSGPRSDIHPKDVLAVYEVVLADGSEAIHSWMRSTDVVLNSYRHTPLLSWYFALPRVGRVIAYQGIKLLGREKFTLDFYSHQILAFMRKTKVYPALSISQTLRMGASLTSDTWFPSQPHSPSAENEELSRELHPVSSMLDLMEENPRAHQVEVRVQEPFPYTSLQDTHPSPLCILPKLISLCGIFSTCVYILEDIEDGGVVLTLAHLVALLKHRVYGLANHSVVSETLDAFLLWKSNDLPEGSQVLLVGIMHEILALERDASSENPCPFPATDIKRLLGFMKDHLSYELSVQTAEWAFDLSTSLPDMVGRDSTYQASNFEPLQGLHRLQTDYSGSYEYKPDVEAPTLPSTRPNQDAEQPKPIVPIIERVQAIYDHVIAERLARRRRATVQGY
ncbi:hypothetical protein FPV67DRAFT_1787973 [Lyophyllum atratum]|nr:hypothetical protein FPV67DRAFT_1787973 [Lyophyllum atratum]